MSFYSDYQGLEEIRVNDEVYVNKKQLLELIKGEQKRYREGTESGYLNLSKKQTIAVDLSLNHLKVLLCKRFYDNLRKNMDNTVDEKVNIEFTKEEFDKIIDFMDGGEYETVQQAIMAAVENAE